MKLAEKVKDKKELLAMIYGAIALDCKLMGQDEQAEKYQRMKEELFNPRPHPLP